MSERDPEAVDALDRLREKMIDDLGADAEPGDTHMVPITIMPKKGGSGRMYALGAKQGTVYPQSEDVVEIHAACQDRFNPDRIDNGEVLGVALLDHTGNVVSHRLRPADAVERRPPE